MLCATEPHVVEQPAYVAGPEIHYAQETTHYAPEVHYAQETTHYAPEVHYGQPYGYDYGYGYYAPP